MPGITTGSSRTGSSGTARQPNHWTMPWPSTPGIPGHSSRKGVPGWRGSRYGEALETLDRLIALEPENGEAWYRKGTIMALLGIHEEAVDLLATALRFEPSCRPALLQSALSYLELGRHREALESLERTIGLDPSEPRSWFYKGVVLERMDRQPEAAAAYDEVIRLRRGPGSKGAEGANPPRAREVRGDPGRGRRRHPDGSEERGLPHGERARPPSASRGRMRQRRHLHRPWRGSRSGREHGTTGESPSWISGGTRRPLRPSAKPSSSSL